MSPQSTSTSQDVATLQTLKPQPHQLMFASLLQWALTLGLLLQSELPTKQAAPKRRLFRRNSSSSTIKKEKKKEKEKKKPTKARSETFRLEPTARDSLTFTRTEEGGAMAAAVSMYWDLEAIGVKLDEVVDLAELQHKVELEGKEQGWTWRKQLEEDREKEEAELSARAAKNALPFARNMLLHEPMEALTLLKFEIDFFKSDNSTRHVASMKKVLQCAHRGVWVDRKPVDGTKPEQEGDREEQQKSYKVVVKRYFIHADAIELFRQEVEAWFAIKHINILKLFGASHCSRPALLVLEDATNGPLVNYLTLQRQLQAEKRRVNLFLEATEGLKYLHEELRLVHSNLKSDNILVTGDGRVKLTDFGLGVLALQDQAIQESKFQEIGWRAPNCLKKKSYRRPSFQDDIYSFGLCVLDVLVPKFSSINPNSRQDAKHVGDEGFNPLSEQVLDLIGDESHKQFVRCMCQENPEMRLSLKQAISRMEEMRDAAAREPADSSDCCIL
ncbi:hypothetical protein PF008_g14276 [Phytophthora fragariae]|uniref:Protein kinase domain-containing protein n=1 Tax=Phytophthora fragariae TaxID=53985 RepID=A0A6G0RIX0_9STRA|nr:hypothetical protein PF008_g14276 [Phytophthora fragariae]